MKSFNCLFNKRRILSVLSFFIALLTIFITNKNFEVYAIPAYCNYNSTTEQCCRRPGAPYGPQILYCSFPDTNDLYCGANGQVWPAYQACPY